MDRRLVREDVGDVLGVHDLDSALLERLAVPSPCVLAAALLILLLRGHPRIREILVGKEFKGLPDRLLRLSEGCLRLIEVRPPARHELVNAFGGSPARVALACSIEGIERLLDPKPSGFVGGATDVVHLNATTPAGSLPRLELRAVALALLLREFASVIPRADVLLVPRAEGRSRARLHGHRARFRSHPPCRGCFRNGGGGRGFGSGAGSGLRSDFDSARRRG